ncbi:MAG: hypothetical protein LBG90_08250 [Spirochaetaceae bacterium]|jgi:hypothetical protein|nr:hypothetical protein [Spirochaetaceae bacterium]
MVKEELIRQSPVRVLEASIKGALRPGEIGVIASPNGVGKTSVLVQIALDQLLQDRKVIHVSFTQHNDYVLAWYESIFEEFVKKQGLESLQQVKDDLVKNRVLMHFNQCGITGDQILRSLKAMIQEGGFKAEALIIDGYDFARATPGDLAGLKTLAQELGLSVWYSCNVPAGPGAYGPGKIPAVIKDYLDFVKALIVLEPQADHIALSVPKDRESVSGTSALRLDPRTLLIR